MQKLREHTAGLEAFWGARREWLEDLGGWRGNLADGSETTQDPEIQQLKQRHDYLKKDDCDMYQQIQGLEFCESLQQQKQGEAPDLDDYEQFPALPSTR